MEIQMINDLCLESQVNVLLEQSNLLMKQLDGLKYIQEEDVPKEEKKTLGSKIKNWFKKVWTAIVGFFKKIWDFFKRKTNSVLTKLKTFFSNHENKKTLEEFERSLKDLNLPSTTKLSFFQRIFHKSEKVVKESADEKKDDDVNNDDGLSANTKIDEKIIEKIRSQKPKWLQIINIISGTIAVGAARSGNVGVAGVSGTVNVVVNNVKDYLSKMNLGIIFIWISVFKQVFDRINNFGKDVHKSASNTIPSMFQLDTITKALLKDCETIDKLITTIEKNTTDLTKDLKQVDCVTMSKDTLMTTVTNLQSYSDALTKSVDAVAKNNVSGISGDQINILASSIIMIISVDGSVKMKEHLTLLKGYISNINDFITNVDSSVITNWDNLPEWVKTLLTKFSTILLKFISSFDKITNKSVGSLKKCDTDFKALKTAIQ